MAHLLKFSLMRIMAGFIISSLSVWRLLHWSLIQRRNLRFVSRTTTEVRYSVSCSKLYRANSIKVYIDNCQMSMQYKRQNNDDFFTFKCKNILDTDIFYLARLLMCCSYFKLYYSHHFITLMHSAHLYLLSMSTLIVATIVEDPRCL